MNQAEFQFRNYFINRSIVEIGDGDVNTSKFGVSIAPTGRMNAEKTKFELTLNIHIKNEIVNIEVETVGHFELTNPTDEFINNFLYINAPALLFPYIRAYISTLSTLSGRKPVILPTLNLTNLGEELKTNVEIVEKL